MLEPPLETQSSTKHTRSRFYNILHRSRSRSKSKSDPRTDNRSSSFDITTKKHNAPITQVHHSSLGRNHSRPTSPISSTEAGVRITSRSTARPLSAATSTTVTPSTPQRRRNKTVPDPITVPHVNLDVPSPHSSLPKTRTKLSHIFAKISGPKKTSRPTSPDPFYDPQHDAPSIALTYRAQSPTISLEMKASATGPSKLQAFRAPRRLSANSVKESASASATKGITGNHSYHDLPRHAVPSEDPGVSIDESRHSSFTNIRSITSPPLDLGSPRKVPQIIHTPPTPQRPSTSPGRVHHRKNSSGSQHNPPHPPPLKTVAEERSSMLDSSLIDTPRSIKGKEKEEVYGNTSLTHVRDSLAAHSQSMTSRTRTTKERRHGSFNFERPTWSSTSLNGRGEEYHSQVVSSSTVLSDNTALRHRNDIYTLVPPSPPPPPPDYSATVSASSSQQSHSQAHSHSTHHTNHTSSTGQRNSSWGRMFDQKIRSKKGGKTVGMSHGQFDFEPAVPSPRSLAFNRQDAEEVAERLKAAQKERDREREKERERQKERERERERALLHQARLAVEASLKRPPTSSTQRSAGFRSGNKGKSLDLGLGLAWAPTKVRQDALLPSFSRSLSGSGSSRNDYRNSRTRESEQVDEHGMLTDGHGQSNSKVGRDVADVFRQALTGTDYALFKKYVHRFDSHEIPFDGPTGIVSRVEILLDHAPALSDEGKRDLLNSFIRIVLQNA